MCYKRPGLRCSGDLLKSLQKHRDTLTQAKRNYFAEVAALRELRDSNFYDPERVEQAKMRVARAREAIDNAKLAYQQDLDEYDATLRGQKELLKMAQEAKEGGMTSRHLYYADRIERAQRLRKRKMAEYRATWGTGGALPEHEGTIPSPDDIFAMHKQDGAIEVVYKGSYKDHHGVCEVVAVEAVAEDGRYTLRTASGEYLHHVRGSSLRMFGD